MLKKLMIKYFIIIIFLIFNGCNYINNNHASTFSFESLYSSSKGSNDSSCIYYLPYKYSKARICYHDSNRNYFRQLKEEYDSFEYLIADSLINLKYPEGLKVKGSESFASLINNILENDNKIITDSILELVISQIYIADISASRSAILLNQSKIRLIDSLISNHLEFKYFFEKGINLSDYQFLLKRQLSLVKELSLKRKESNKIYFVVFYKYSLDLFYANYLIKNNKISFEAYLLNPILSIRRVRYK